MSAASEAGEQPGGAISAEAPLTDAQKRQLTGAVSKLVSASIGDIVVVMSRAASHKHYSLADIEWMVLPPVLAGQFYVAEAAHKEHGFRAPVAVVTWASVSAETDARLAVGDDARVRLRPDEWTGGEHLWLIDTIGDARGINVALNALMEGPLKDKEVKVAVRDSDGAVKVQTLAGLVAAARGASGAADI